MKKLLLGIIAINLTFISANLAMAQEMVGAADPQEDVFTGGHLYKKIITNYGDVEDSDEGEESGEAADLNDINSETTGTITATVGDGEEEPE